MEDDILTMKSYKSDKKKCQNRTHANFGPAVLP